MNRILFKTITRAFYQQNTGFFLFLLLVAFGLFRGSDHVLFADLGLQTWPILIGVFFSIWVLYTLKVIQFVLKSFTDPKQEFLYVLRLIPKEKQFGLLFSVHYVLLQPILAYGLFVCARGISTSEWISVGGILSFLGLLLVVPVLWYMKALQAPNDLQNRKYYFSTLLNTRFSKPYPFFFLFHLLKEQKMLLFSTKVLSAFFIVGVCRLFTTDSYDHRLVSIGILLSVMAHTQLTARFHGFENQHLLFSRNLPFSLAQRFFLQALSYGLLLIPDLILLAKNLPGPIPYSFLLSGVMFQWGLLLAWHHFQYVNPGNPERSSMVLFSGFFISLLLIMFKVPVAMIGVIFLGIGAVLFWRGYGRVEYLEG